MGPGGQVHITCVHEGRTCLGGEVGILICTWDLGVRYILPVYMRVELVWAVR